jgi:hypothetical protein
MAEDETKSDTKQSWPELSLVGMTGEEAKSAVLAVDNTLEVHIVPHNSMVTMDYREDRVRIYVGDDSKVIRQPRNG